jgi:Ca2+-binding RTX toxin-like protein
MHFVVNQVVKFQHMHIAHGGDGDDFINQEYYSGDSGVNVINGGAGNDTIRMASVYGGRGFDTVTGGTGADLFILSDQYVLAGGNNTATRNTITDFSRTDGDKLALGFANAGIDSYGFNRALVFRDISRYRRFTGYSYLIF